MFSLWTRLQTPWVMAPSLRHSARVRARRYCPCARKQRRPWSEWCLGSRKAIAHEMDTFFFWRVVDFRTRRHRMEPGGGKRVKGGTEKKSKKVASTARRQMKQFCALTKQLKTPLAATLAGSWSISGRPWVWGCGPKVCPERMRDCSVFFFLS